MKYHINSCAWEHIHVFLDGLKGIHTMDQGALRLFVKPFGLLYAVDANGVYCLTPTGIGATYISVLRDGLRLAFGNS
jgi:hypothetical protein